MIKVVDNGEEFYYDTASEVWEDYPNAEIHNGIATID